jgi:hypothetical protein
LHFSEGCTLNSIYGKIHGGENNLNQTMQKNLPHKKKSLHFQMSVNIFLNDANDCKMFDALILKMQTKKKNWKHVMFATLDLPHIPDRLLKKKCQESLNI